MNEPTSPRIAPLRRTSLTQNEEFSTILGAVEQLEALVGQARLEAQADRTISAATQQRVRRGFGLFLRRIDAALGDGSSLDPELRAQLGTWLQRRLMPYLELSPNAHRWFTKPRGYAGDFLSIEQVYLDEARGDGPLGVLLDRCFLDVPAAKAVRNRRGLLQREISSALAGSQGRAARVTSMASGPARELFDVYAGLDRPERLVSTLVDIDPDALAFVDQHARRRGVRAPMTLHRANLVHLALGRTTLDIPPQDLVYSIGLIDYLSDRHVVRLLDYIHSILAPGGRVILGNFHPRNQTKALMDHVLEWRLIHRDEEDMHRLFETSAFGRQCSEIEFEDEGINLFATGVKPAASGVGTGGSLRVGDAAEAEVWLLGAA